MIYDDIFINPCYYNTAEISEKYSSLRKPLTHVTKVALYLVVTIFN